MIKSVLVHLNPKTNTTGVLQVALELAGQHRAHLIGLAFSEEVADERPTLERTFHERAGQRHLSYEWSPIAGDEAAVVVLEARCHDLLVIGQIPSGDGRSWWYPHKLLQKVLWKSGHPLENACWSAGTVAARPLALSRTRCQSSREQSRSRWSLSIYALEMPYR